MLLTLKQPGHHGFNKSFHDYSPPTPPTTACFSPALNTAVPSFPSSVGPITSSTNHVPLDTAPNSKPLPQIPQSMSTPHRGLPPPAAMTLPQPASSHAPLPPSLSGQPMGQLPAPPQQWQGAEESMRNWLQAKSEEDKRKQEEEKTRQESLRLEQRKIEQDMLRTSVNSGIPPYMIPMVFAGMGGGNLPNASLEWAQHYMAQAHQLQQQQLQQQQQHQPASSNPPQPHSSPELRRESRQIAHVFGNAPQHAPPVTLPSTPMGASGASQQGAVYTSTYPMSPSSRNRTSLPGPGSLTRGPPSSNLPRLNTGEMHIQQPPPPPAGMQILPGQPAHPLQQSQSASQNQPESHSSPSIYFHHWQPPNTQSGSGAAPPVTPSDAHSSSPKKRKAQGPQQAAPPPSNQPQYTSPPFSQGGSSATGTPSTRRRHSRQRSDLSSRGVDSYGRPGSRHQHTDGNFGLGTQRAVSPIQGYDLVVAGASSAGEGMGMQQGVRPHIAHQYSGPSESIRHGHGHGHGHDERRSTEQDREREREPARDSLPGAASTSQGSVSKRDDMRD